MRLLGQHIQSIDTIRELAIVCHALDEAAQSLFYTGTYGNRSPATKEAYEALLSRSLLHLAVAIRTNLYQNRLALPESDYLSPCGFLDVTTKGKVETRPFSIKDVCDKIIHAETIERHLNRPEAARTVHEIGGRHGKSQWRLDISVEMFCAAVLNWLDDLEFETTGSAT